MIDRQTVQSLIEDCQTQIAHCDDNITYEYPDDPEQIEAFERKIEHYEFMIARLQTFL